MSKNLTIKQMKFIDAYLECGNASQAYRQSYSCERMKDATINVKASELLKNGKIRVRIRELQGELKKTSDIKKETILEELAAIAFSDIRDYVKFDGKTITFKSFDELTDKQARAVEAIKETKFGIELKLHGKSWTINSICRILGFDSALDFNLNLENMTDSAIDAIIERLIPKNK